MRSRPGKWFHGPPGSARYIIQGVVWTDAVCPSGHAGCTGRAFMAPEGRCWSFTWVPICLSRGSGRAEMASSRHTRHRAGRTPFPLSNTGGGVRSPGRTQSARSAGQEPNLRPSQLRPFARSTSKSAPASLATRTSGGSPNSRPSRPDKGSDALDRRPQPSSPRSSSRS